MSALQKVFENVSATDFRREISKELIDSEKNISVKTDIDSVATFAVLETITLQIENQKLSKTTETLKKFTNEVYKLSLSKDRKSRDEYLEAIKGLSNLQEQQTQKVL